MKVRDRGKEGMIVRFKRRRLPGRRLPKPSQAAGPLPQEPLELPPDTPGAGSSTEIAISAVQSNAPAARPKGGSQETTVELPALRPGAGTGSEPGLPPRMEFTCACGAMLVATPELYDQRTRCGLCQAILLLSVVYDPERRSHEIVPFKVDSGSLP